MQIGNNKTLFPVSNSFQTIKDMQTLFDKLQVQLGTGKKAATLSEMGNDRSFSLTVRERLNRIDAYNANINTVGLRLGMFNNVLSRLDQVEADSRSAVSSGGAGSDGLNLASATSQAKARLDETLTLLNTDLNGRYLFGGNVTDKKPVATTDTLLNGDGVRDGFKTVAAQRQMADMGDDNLGRLDTGIAGLTAAIPGAPETVTLSEADPVANPYGPKLAAVATDSAGYISVAAPSGSPASLSVSFDDSSVAPVDGETVTVTVQLPDGSTEDHVFTAVSGTPANASEFQIGATPADTATNFQATLDGALTPDRLTLAEDGDHPFGLKLGSVTATGSAFSVSEPGGTPPQVLSIAATGTPAAGDKLSFQVFLPDGSPESFGLTATDGTPGDGEFAIGATPEETIANVKSALEAQIKQTVTTKVRTVSLYEAADGFFNGQGQSVMRVDGPDYYNATTISAASDADTVFWYQGQDSGGNPRDTVTAKVDDSTRVSYGVQANESGPAQLVRSLAVLAVDDFDTSDDTSVARYNYTAQKLVNQLSDLNNANKGSIEGITLDLSIAQAAVGSASDRHKSYSAQLQTTLSDLEGAPVEDVAVQLTQLQTRLQASYQTMSIVNGLSLVNYLR